MSTSCPLCEIAATVRAKRERRKDARPGELLAAALELFVEKGFAATRAEEVAKRAGVSKGTLFLYFSSKKNCSRRWCGRTFRAGLTSGMPKSTVFRAVRPTCCACIRAWWERIGSTKVSGITKLMMSEAGNFPELATFYQQEVIRPGQRVDSSRAATRCRPRRVPSH
jgi:TetR/AcrR family transcriptional regulator